jgi:aminoglycoside phosphotransferase (APT) family kinase protein
MQEQVTTKEALADALADELSTRYNTRVEIDNMLAVAAGASRDTWSFDATEGDGLRHELILKRDPPATKLAVEGVVQVTHGIDRMTEARLMELAGEAGVPEPEVVTVTDPGSAVGAGFVMTRVGGESLGGRIVRNDEFADARKILAHQCGEALARSHAIDMDKLPELRVLSPLEHLALYTRTLDWLDTPQPGFEYGAKWLQERIELAGGRQTLVHGDFRNGNLLVDEKGLTTVLDWELGHIGDPMCDLGWLCVRSWRYGVIDKPVGGFGEREELFKGYEDAGGPTVDPEVVRYWEIFGCLRWGLMCLQMGYAHLSNSYRSIERAVIARRASETEYDLMQLLD